MFHRSQDEKGRWATRCLYCFMTLASELETAAEVERKEQGHLCPERVLAEQRNQEAPPKPAK